ncbi:MAG: Dna2/Cas4 domain-containing protein [Crocinitomicaceae bacterium]|nr:Dna2/Cas4 domain-containing protein [Crocinitomicaceae bacterium]
MELDRCLHKGLIEDNDVDLIQSEIEKLFQDSKFAAYFSANAMNEKVIINTSGKKFIPDKLIFNSEEVIVVDFKTGKRSPKHIEQVLEYVNLLKDMGNSVVRGEIYYTENGEVISI